MATLKYKDPTTGDWVLLVANVSSLNLTSLYFYNMTNSDNFYNQGTRIFVYKR